MIHKVLMFSASWCGPCQKAKPKFKELGERYAELAEFELLDVDESAELAQKYMIRSVPCFIMLQEGEEALRSVGNLEQIEKALRLVQGGPNV
jgi:thiol-disulfide isomerase/thioredoxin